ncbi:BglG family transcription antiterminator [Pectinatus sottacetonis]|uniref:BglG family transcription antiterminator n=1 Tax=Pectinatus sottacetonis TaxID=1002795 RepID=UPI0018C6481E|nr:transcription antiterminator [Pectinatus sottacetonis]
MNNTILSSRIKNIILILCEQKSFITIREIAEKLNVSTKTITRELMKIDKLLSSYNVALDKKQGVGIALKCSKKTIAKIKTAFISAPEQLIYQPQERYSFLTARLLQNQQPIKLFELASELNVAESTISTDLDKLEKWFISHELSLIRKPGLGVYVSGSEKNIRKAILHYIYENINETDLIEILHDTLSNGPTEKSSLITSSQRLLHLVDTQIIYKLETVIHHVEAAARFKLSDNAYAGLLIHLALAIQRMRQNEKITFDDKFFKEISNKHEFSISKQLAQEIEKVFDINIPDAEIGYIAMHLMGTRNQYYTGSTTFIPNFQLVQIAKKIIKIAQIETGQLLDNNEKLLIGLVNHLGPSISRLQMGMEIRNPLLNDIKKEYASLMDVSKICCNVLHSIVKGPIPESEIAYIAMHLGAALENITLKPNDKYHAAIACPTGLGSSKLLASRIKHEFPNIQIIDIISALRLTSNAEVNTQIDFIISTVPIPNAEIPVITVNPLLKNTDITTINTFLTNFKRKTKKKLTVAKKSLSFKEQLLHLIYYQKAILNILDNFIFLNINNITSINDIINVISTNIHDVKASPNIITKDLTAREDYGHTVLQKQKIILLHCRSSVESAHFAIIRFNDSTLELESDCHTKFIAAVVMIIPHHCTPELPETMGSITEALIENWLLSSTIANNNKTEIKYTLENILKNFLKEKINTLIN